VIAPEIGWMLIGIAAIGGALAFPHFSEALEIIDILYESVEGYHRFTCPQIPGFCIIVEPDQYNLAVEYIPDTIALMIMGDSGKRVTVRREDSYSDYAKIAPKSQSFLHYSIHKSC
jgi:hypothetical protein